MEVQTAITYHSLPSMSLPAICAMDEYLLEYMTIFEWGSGGSTHFFERKAANVITLEHDKEWFKKTVKEMKSSDLGTGFMQIIPPEYIANPPFQSHQPEWSGWSFEDYVKAIDAYPDEHFDLISIDGRARSACLRRALPKLKQGGWLVLDDAQREIYQEAMAEIDYPYIDYTGPIPYQPEGMKVTTRIWRKEPHPAVSVIEPITIAACMIVKDEEELLPDCLESIQGLVDEIICVDTGSTDRTVEIAESYGAKVFHHEWTGDFSLHRNQSLAYAESKYNFIIDADERTDGAGILKIVEEMERKGLSFAALDVVSEHETGASLNRQERIFKRGAVVYEESIQNEAHIQFGHGMLSNHQIIHLGYNLTAEKMTEKNIQREMMLLEAIDRTPGKCRLWQYLIRRLAVQSKWDEVLRIRDELNADVKAGEINLTTTASQAIEVDAVVALIALERWDEALEAVNGVLDKYPNNMDALYFKSQITTHNEDAEATVGVLTAWAVARNHAEYGGIRTSPLIGTWGLRGMVYNNLGVVYSLLNEPARSLESFFLAGQFDPDSELIQSNRGKALAMIVGMQQAKQT